MSNQENPENSSFKPKPGLTRAPLGKPKFKLTPKSGNKPGTKPAFKLSGSKPIPTTQPPFAKVPPPDPSLSTELPLPTSTIPPSPPIFESKEETLPLPPTLGESSSEEITEPESIDESVPEESFAQEESLQPLPPPPPILPSMGGILPPPPSLGESNTEEGSEPKSIDEIKSEEFTDQEDTEPSSTLPPSPSSLPPTGGILPPPPSLGESNTEESAEGESIDETNSGDFSDQEESDPGSIEQDEFESIPSLPPLASPSLSPMEEVVSLESPHTESASEDLDEFDDEKSGFESEKDSKGEDSDIESEEGGASLEMSPFEISENFRNLKVNIMMIKGKLKEVETNKDLDSSNDFGEEFSTLTANVDTLSSKFENSESTKEENKKIIRSLLDQVKELKERGESESNSDNIEDLKTKLGSAVEFITERNQTNTNSIEELKSTIEKISSRTDSSENKNSEFPNFVEVNEQIEEIFTKIEDLTSVKSELKTRIFEIQSNIDELNTKLSNFSVSSLPNEEPPPPPFIGEESSDSKLEKRVRDIEETIDELSTEFHSLGETGSNESSSIPQSNKASLNIVENKGSELSLDDQTQTRLKKSRNLKSFF